MAREKQPPTLEKRVARFIREHHLVPRGSCLLVAVSGGADSTCLLHLLVGLKDELGVRLHVAHLDHQLRGAESEADAAYIARLTHQLGLGATIERRDVIAYKKEKRLSLEEAAREVRYRFLAETASLTGARRVATGHTLDDQVETLLMHLVRGTGTRGLTGLKPCSQWRLDDKGVTVVRPLLEVSRQETADYCQSHKLNPRIDASNLELSPLRNRIRHQLLPLLKSYNPKVAEALLRTAAVATDELAFLDSEVSRLWSQVVQKQQGIFILDKERFYALPPAVKRHLLRVAIEELWGSLKDIETRHIEEIMTALDKPGGKQVSLPGGLIFTVDYDRYLLGLEPASLCPFPVLEGEFDLKVPGETKLPGWQVTATIIDLKEESERGEAPLTNLPLTLDMGSVKGRSPFTNYSSPSPLKERGTEGVRLRPRGLKPEGLIDNLFTAHLDLDKTGDKIIVRPRKRGDRFQPLGLSQPKKLGEFMIDAKIPHSWRGRIPIVCSPEHIIWLVGWRLDERVKVTEDIKKVLRLEFKRC